MDKFLKVFVEEVKIFWKDLRDGIKNKIKKIVCNCKCHKTD